MANINVKNDEIRVPDPAPLGVYFTVEFTLNNREAIPAFGSGGCNIVRSGTTVAQGHPTKAELEVSGPDGSVIKTRSVDDESDVVPSYMFTEGNMVCCPIEGSNEPDPTISLDIIILGTAGGNYTLTARYIPQSGGNPVDEVSKTIEVLPEDEIDNAPPPDEGDTPSTPAIDNLDIVINDAVGQSYQDQYAWMSYEIANNSDQDIVADISIEPGNTVNTETINGSSTFSYSSEFFFDNTEDMEQQLCVDVLEAYYAQE